MQWYRGEMPILPLDPEYNEEKGKKDLRKEIEEVNEKQSGSQGWIQVHK